MSTKVMKTLTIKNDYYIRYPGEVDYIKKIINKSGYLLTLPEIQEVWLKYSDSFNANWLGVKSYTDEDILTIVLDYTEVL